MRKRIYFAHPINVYGTKLEADIVAMLEEAFPDWEIVNPGTPEFQLEFEAYRAEHPEAPEMEFFYRSVDSCQGGAILAFRDGRIGAGVFGEAVKFFERGCPVYEIFVDKSGAPALVALLTELDPKRALTIDETKERIRHADGSTKPY